MSTVAAAAVETAVDIAKASTASGVQLQPQSGSSAEAVCFQGIPYTAAEAVVSSAACLSAGLALGNQYIAAATLAVQSP